MKLVHTIVALCATVVLPAADLDQSARKTLLDHLDKSSSEFIASVKGLTPEQWNYKPSAEVWSVAECAEHITLTEGFLREMIEKKVLASTAKPSGNDDDKALDEKVLKMITDRSSKAKAPEPLKPTRQFPTPADAIKKFQESREKTKELAASRNDLRDHVAPHFVLKELDAYQWLLYLSGHTMRHTAQIREVKADRGFPKK